MTKATRFWLTMFILSLVVFLAGCDASWTSQASAIISLIGPALTAVMALLSAFGVNVPAPVLMKITALKDDAMTTLMQTVKPAIEEYDAAAPEDRDTLLERINVGLHAVEVRFSDILNELHIFNPAVQQKATSAFGAVIGLVESLIALVPILKAKGAVTLDDAHKAKLLTPDQFTHTFNKLMTAKTGDPAVDARLHEFTI